MCRVRSSVLLLFLAALTACADANDNPARVNPLTPPAAAASEVPGESEFRMTVADAFKIATGGVVVTGEVTAGHVIKGDTVCLPSARLVEVMAIEVFKLLVESAGVGDRVGLLLSNITVEDVTVGDEINTACLTES